MSDAGALYLSYVLVDHHDPSYLLKRVPPAKAGPEQHQLDCYDQTKCRGIIYTAEKLTKTGNTVLKLAEEERRKGADGISPSESNDVLGSLIKADELPEHSRTMAMLNDHFKTSSTHRRRTSGSTNGHIGPAGTPPKVMSDLDRARSRVQGEELERTGQYGNDLWRCAINMLCLCREIQYPRLKETPPAAQATKPAVQATNPPVTEVSHDALGEDFPMLPPSGPPKPKKPIIKTLDVPGFPLKKPKVTILPLPLGNGNPNQAIMTRSQSSRKFSLPEKLNGSSLPSNETQLISPGTKFKEAIARLKTKEYRSRLPCGFTEEIWWKILGQAVGAQDLMSQAQQRSVLSWAIDRNTLKKEREWLVEKEGNQLWHVLDGMTCLAYESDS